MQKVSLISLLFHLPPPNPTHSSPLGVCVTYLQGQYKARKMRAEQGGYNWPTLGQQFRSKHTQKLKMAPNDNSDTMAYLKKMVLHMMNADGKRDRPSNADTTQLSGLLRAVPTLSHESLNRVILKSPADRPRQTVPGKKKRYFTDNFFCRVG
jgi:hypothetical protein